MAKSIIKKSGGLRIPSEETLRAHHIELSLESQKLIKLITNIKPKKFQIHHKDLKRLKAIGGGNPETGFYHVLRLAHQCWITQQDLFRLMALAPSGKNNPREGLLYAMELAEKHIELNPPKE